MKISNLRNFEEAGGMFDPIYGAEVDVTSWWKTRTERVVKISGDVWRFVETAERAPAKQIRKLITPEMQAEALKKHNEEDLGMLI